MTVSTELIKYSNHFYFLYITAVLLWSWNAVRNARCVKQVRDHRGVEKLVLESWCEAELILPLCLWRSALVLNNHTFWTPVTGISMWKIWDFSPPAGHWLYQSGTLKSRSFFVSHLSNSPSHLKMAVLIAPLLYVRW